MKIQQKLTNDFKKQWLSMSIYERIAVLESKEVSFSEIQSWYSERVKLQKFRKKGMEVFNNENF